MIRFTLNVNNAEKLDSALTGLRDQIKDWRGAWPKVSEKLTEIEVQLFDFVGATGGHGKWADLKPAYARAKQTKRGLAPILQASGRLQDSLTGKSSDRIDAHEPLVLRWGTEVPYAVFHQAGTRKMVARQIFDFTRENRMAMQSTLHVESQRFVRRLGFDLTPENIGPREVTTGAATPGLGLSAITVPLSSGI